MEKSLNEYKYWNLNEIKSYIQNKIRLKIRGCKRFKMFFLLVSQELILNNGKSDCHVAD